MPVKVRCGGCEQVLNVPDKARGKAVACPKCGERIKVPSGENPASPKTTAPAKGVAKPKATKGDGKFLGGLDDYGIEDQNDQICPFCAEPIDEEDEICPGCGRDLESGQMNKKEAVKRSKEGKSTAAFYKNAFRESWDFMWEYKGLAVRTGVILSVFTVLYMACYFMVLYCEKMPPRVFWVAMTTLMAVGSPGWIWFLTRKLVTAGLYHEPLESDRIHYDFFTNVALGLAAFLWPCVVSLPVILVVGITAGFLEYQSQLPEISATAVALFGLAIMALPAIAFPIATVHMVAKHQHKAWIGWELIKLIFKNIGPICVYHASSVLMVSIFGSIAFAAAYFGGELHVFNNSHVLGWSASMTTWFYDLVGSPGMESGSFMYVIVQMPLLFMFGFLFVTPFMLLLGFPLLFQMKVNALIAKHFSHSLDLDQRIFPLSPAGFWVRFLAFWVDFILFPLSPLIVTRDKRFVIMGWLLYGMIVLSSIYVFGFESMPIAILYTQIPITVVYLNWMYSTVSLSGTIRATLGMEAFGLVVIPDIPNPRQKDLDKVLTLGQASLRWASVTFGSMIIAGLSFLGCAFHPEKKAPHDLLCKSKVVFQGDK